MVPYFIAGLRENERCLWITAPPLPAHEASQALRAASDDFDQWYGSLGRLKGLDVIHFWLEEEERALAEGYNGLRITGNASFLTPGDAHHCAFERPDTDWQVIAASEFSSRAG
jgi:hypothetical protein